MSSSITAAVFDVDNTQLDFYTMKKHCVKAGLEKMISRGLPVSFDEAERILDEVFRNEGWEDQRLFWHVAEYAGIKDQVNLERFAQLGKTAYRKHQRDYLQPYEGMRETLTYLRDAGIRLAILSDAPRLKVFDRVCDADLEEFFEDRVVGAEKDDPFKKPSAVAFQRVLDVLKLNSPQGVIMVGDQPYRDVLGAKNNGFIAAWAKYGYIPKHDEDINTVVTRADYVLEKPTDLIEIVKKYA